MKKNKSRKKIKNSEPVTSRLSAMMENPGNVSGSSELAPTNFQQENPGNHKFIPKFYVVNSPSASSAMIFLDKDQTIFCNKGCLNYCDIGVKVETKTGGVLQGLLRSLATSESMFMTYYTGTGLTDSENQNSPKISKNIVSLAGFLPGDLVGIEIKPGERYSVSSNSFIAATFNLKLDIKTRFRNLFGGGGVFMSEVYNDSQENGILWVCSFGGIEHLHIPNGTSMKIDNGLFVVAKSEYEYTISKVGGWKSFFLGGEGIVMNFKGPCDIYIQSRSITNFLSFIQMHVGGGNSSREAVVIET